MSLIKMAFQQITVDRSDEKSTQIIQYEENIIEQNVQKKKKKITPNFIIKKNHGPRK